MVTGVNMYPNPTVRNTIMQHDTQIETQTTRALQSYLQGLGDRYCTVVPDLVVVEVDARDGVVDLRRHAKKRRCEHGYRGKNTGKLNAPYTWNAKNKTRTTHTPQRYLEDFGECFCTL